ncbi:MAG: lipopolysaccharide biosynthesis protein [Sphingomonadaceae bacterium]|nr:lipopolysaccharide biosynthesis protein [Sphingomonadaceae bacterium]
MNTSAPASNPSAPSLRDQVRSAVIWRSGTQIVGQLITWASTFLVIRILAPSDYGLYAMTSVVVVLLSLVNGYGLANALIQKRDVSPLLLRQLFGMLIVLNGTLATIQFFVAPLVAAYYGQPLVTDILRAQALIYLTNPFLALGYAVLSRKMDFRKQAQVNLGSALMAAAAALTGAFLGLGVWTLVFAPMVGFAARAFGTAYAARIFIRPSFNFSGAWSLARYGSIVALGEFFWFLQTQADIVIAGRSFEPHLLGIYTTSLFLTQMFVSKFVPPINEVAFSAYSRVQSDKEAMSNGFLKSIRIIMLAGLPFCLGLAASAEAVVQVVLGEKWLATAPVITILGFAMPFMTLHVLFGPAVNAAGRPGIDTRNSMLGAIILPLGFLAGVQWGVTGLAATWVIGYPLLAGLSAIWVLPILGVRARELLAAIAPPMLAGLFMFAVVKTLDAYLSATLPPVTHLAALVSAGAFAYGAFFLLFARERIFELLDLVRRSGS